MFARSLLAMLEQMGHVHVVFYGFTMRAESPQFVGTCNCCDCCWGVFRGKVLAGLTEGPQRSNYRAVIDPETCAACVTCIERCPVDDIAEDENSKSKVERAKCIGCGVCVIGCAMTAVIFPGFAHAQSDASADRWTFSIMPYLWLPNINGTLKYSVPPGAGGSPAVEAGPNNYLEALQAVIMISGEVRMERWSVFTDLIYLDFSDEKSSVKSVNFGGSLVSSSVNIATSSSFRGLAWTLGTGYAVRTGQAVTLDVFVGLRYFGLEASTDWSRWQSPDRVAGKRFRGTAVSPRGRISGMDRRCQGACSAWQRHWSIPYYLDLGAGSSCQTWQGMLGVAYSFKWGGVTLAYRSLTTTRRTTNLSRTCASAARRLA